MSWANSLQDASFRGVKFDVVRTRDGRQKATAAHEYPYLDGADIEDMGARARHFSLTAIFWGDNYESALQGFIKALDQLGSAELIHPIYGSIPKAQVLDYEVEHDADHVDHCLVELHFEESTPSNPFFVQQLPAQKARAVSVLTTTARSGGIAAFGSALSSLKSAQGNLQQLNALRDVMTSTLSAVRGQIQGIIGTTLDIIEYPQAFAADIVSYFSGMADLRSFDIGVIGSDWKSLTDQFGNVVQLPGSINRGTAVTSSPTGMVSVGLSPVTSGLDPTSGVPITPVAIASTAALMPAGADPSNVNLVEAVVRLAATLQLADTASSILASEADAPTLSPVEIEQIIDDTRTAIEATIAQHRAAFDIGISRPVTETLKDIALAIQTAAIVVINALPTLTTRMVDAPGNLTLIAFRWYGDYTRADELGRLNPAIRNPNFVLPGTLLNAYAK